MKKSLVKYIISSQKENVCFEDRLSEIFSRSLDSETSLETLVYGIPKSVNVLDTTELKNRIESRYNNGCVRCKKINEVEIASDFRIVVRYEHSYRRYFATEEQRDDAIKNGRKYDGSSDKDSGHPFEGWINNLSDSIRFDIDELENVVEVVRE